MSKILVVVHVEPIMFPVMPSGLGRDIQRYYLKSNEFSDMINITAGAELSDRDPVLPEFRFAQQEHWAWGYYPDAKLDIEGETFIRVSTHHECAQLTDWMFSLSKENEYILVGGSEEECLQDIYECLLHLGLNVSKGPCSLIY